jgi:hypothetical protein
LTNNIKQIRSPKNGEIANKLKDFGSNYRLEREKKKKAGELALQRELSEPILSLKKCVPRVDNIELVKE